MNRWDKFRLSFSRSWKFPGQARLLKYLKLSDNALGEVREGIIWLEDEDIAIHTSADNYIENSILTTGTYENEIKKLINLSLVEGDVAIDVGCNLGLQALRMSKAVGASGKVIAFEPLTYLRNKSEKNFVLNRITNVKLLPFALSDKEDSIEITIDENIYNQGTFSLLQKPAGNKKERISVRVGDTVDDLVHLTKLELIKIDVEGFELNVLKGLEKTIERFHPRIIFEFDRNYWIRNNQNDAEAFDFLKKRGYTLYQITFFGCQIINQYDQMADGNIFCIAS